MDLQVKEEFHINGTYNKIISFLVIKCYFTIQYMYSLYKCIFLLHSSVFIVFIDLKGPYHQIIFA
jgi:hypothetical protein